MQKLQNNKEAILAIIKSQGPSYPGRIARSAGLQPLFVSAFLSELVSEKRLKISNLKVGSSPLYFMPGQEESLANFVDNLGGKERKAFELLKQNQVLKEDTLDPAIRVALKSIKDFAQQVTVRNNGEPIVFWKFFTTSTDQTRMLIEQIVSGRPKQAEVQKEPEQKQDQPIQQEDNKPTLTKDPPKEVENVVKKEEEFVEKTSEPKKTTNPKSPSEFAEAIRDYLEAKDVEIMDEITEKKKEFIAKVRFDHMFGKQELYLVAKDKKKVNTNDLTIAIQNAQSEKMPALFIAPGELDKKAKDHIREWRNMVKFERITI